MKYLPLLALLLLISVSFVLSHTSNTGSNSQLNQCLYECNQEYEAALKEAIQMANSGSYYEAVTSSNCPRVRTGTWNGESGRYARCVVQLWECQQAGGTDCTRNAAMQNCCKGEAQVAAKNALKSCQDICYYNYPESDEEDTTPAYGGGDIGDTGDSNYDAYCEDRCLYDSNTGVSTYYYQGEFDEYSGQCNYKAVKCQNGCNAEGTACAEQGNEGDKCANVECKEYYCEDGTYYYDGYCNSEDGQCYYYTFECDNGCNASSNKCNEKVVNTEAPNIYLTIEKPAVLLKDNAQDRIQVDLRYDNGTVVKGAKLHIRIDDPHNTGVLGKWGFRDAIRYTDANGEYVGTLKLPSIKEIKSMYYDDFPLTLDVTVTASKHDDSDDWSTQTNAQIMLQSPMPKITSVKISPNPAKAYALHNVYIQVDDPDSSHFKYYLRNYGGQWKSESRFRPASSNNVILFDSDKKNEVVQWMSPARGLNKDEIIMAREMTGVLTGTATSVALTSAEKGAEYAGEKLAGKAAKFFGYVAPGIKWYKGVTGLWGNMKNMAQGIDGVVNAKTYKEMAYRSLDFALEGGKATIGAVSLVVDEVPVIGQAADITQDLADGLVGSMQGKLKDLAAKERIANAKNRTADYAFYVVVEDEDGNRADYFYDFKMQYLGFEGD